MGNNIVFLKGKYLIDGNGDGIVDNPVVVLDGSRIREVGTQNQIEIPVDAPVIDMDGCTLMPGLIDAHVHLGAPNVLSFRNYRVAMFETTPQLLQMYMLFHAQTCFEMGFTTLRDMNWVTYNGQIVNEMVAVRDAIKRGIMAGPRILVSGWSVITSSHLELCIPGNIPRQPGVTADGPWELRKLTRSNLRAGCDFVKTCATAGIGYGSSSVRNMTQEEMNAIVDEAHAFNKLCACHCFTAESQKMAIRANFDTIEHCVFTDDEAIAMIKASDKYVIPTLAHRSNRSIDARRLAGAPEATVKNQKRIQPYTKDTFQRMHQAGIKMAMGTDTEIDPAMGGNAYELEIYVDHGMTPMEAIQTATKNAAEALRMDGDIGTLEAGKLADIIAVKGNPLQDIAVLQNKEKIRLVLKDGHIFVDKRRGHNKQVIHDHYPKEPW